MADDLPALALLSATPPWWGERSAGRLPELLADHAVCELQASVFALSLVGLYPEDARLVERLSALAAEELRHFRRVLPHLRRAGGTLPARRRNPYVAALRRACRSGREPEQGLDLLLTGALVEARSHERFLVLVPFLSDRRLARFYEELAEAEERHGPAYLELAVRHAGRNRTEARLGELLAVEAEAIAGPEGGRVAVHAPL